MRNIGPREVRSLIRGRRIREQYFPADLFAEPAWDMLLDLYAAGLEGGRVSVSSLCIAAAVPSTTALRHIGLLENAGLVEREPHRTDKRKFMLSLSQSGVDAMRDYFARLAA